MQSDSIAIAVLQLHAPIRNRIGVRELLPLLARDPTSRLSGIRDVTLHMLPACLPDLRRGLDTETDLKLRDQFIRRYRSASRRDLERLTADFPELPDTLESPTGRYHKVRCHDGCVTIIGKSGTVTYRDRVPIARIKCGNLEYRGNNAFYVRTTGSFIIDGTSHFYPCHDSGECYVLPCGLVLESSRYGSKLVNVATCEYRVVNRALSALRYSDDYGDMCGGAATVGEDRLHYL